MAIEEAERIGFSNKQKQVNKQKEVKREADLLHQQRRKEPPKEAFQAAKVTSEPRNYQKAYLERCKLRNTLVYLGTGRGKSKSYHVGSFARTYSLSTNTNKHQLRNRSAWIAWDIIRHYASEFEQGKQTIFVAPTRELASQQMLALQANLEDYTVSAVQGKSIKNDDHRTC